jgi:hypothetical protein
MRGETVSECHHCDDAPGPAGATDSAACAGGGDDRKIGVSRPLSLQAQGLRHEGADIGLEFGRSAASGV